MSENKFTPDELPGLEWRTNEKFNGETARVLQRLTADGNDGNHYSVYWPRTGEGETEQERTQFECMVHGAKPKRGGHGLPLIRREWKATAAKALAWLRSQDAVEFITHHYSVDLSIMRHARVPEAEEREERRHREHMARIERAVAESRAIRIKHATRDIQRLPELRANEREAYSDDLREFWRKCAERAIAEARELGIIDENWTEEGRNG